MESMRQSSFTDATCLRRHWLELIANALRVRCEFEATYGREPSPEEVADQLGITESLWTAIVES